MTQIVSGVLKHNRVRPSGPRPIGGAPVVGRAQPHAAARIVQQEAGHAVVEVTCACGSVIRLRCAFESAPPAATAAP